jgi:hypothetical protein
MFNITQYSKATKQWVFSSICVNIHQFYMSKSIFHNIHKYYLSNLQMSELYAAASMAACSFRTVPGPHRIKGVHQARGIAPPVKNLVQSYSKE